MQMSDLYGINLHPGLRITDNWIRAKAPSLFSTIEISEARNSKIILFDDNHVSCNAELISRRK